MRPMVILAFLSLLATHGHAQSDYWTRPQAPEPYTSLWQRTPPPQTGGGELTPVPSLPLSPAPTTTPASPEYLFSIPGGFPQTSQTPSQALPPSPIPPGLLFRVQLLTGVLATPLMDTPVLAQAEPTWCGKEACQPLTLIGTASFAPNARAVVTFHAAALEGQVYSLQAVAFDPNDRLYGLSGEVKDIAPTLAADLLRAAASGLADWVQALNRQSQTTVLPEGGLATSFEAAPVWAYALGRIGGVFALPQNATTIVRALIRGAGESVLVATLPQEPGKRQNGTP